MSARLDASRRARAIVAASLTALTLGATAAHAQRPATPIPQRQLAVAMLLPDGAYDLTLTPATFDQRSLASAPPIALSARIAHNGTSVTMTTSDGLTLSGTSSVTHLKASGPVQHSTLTLELGGRGTAASGTFALVGRAGRQMNGTVTVVPAPRYMTHTAKQGCSGFWDCVKTITGYDWSTIFG